MLAAAFTSSNMPRNNSTSGGQWQGQGQGPDSLSGTVTMQLQNTLGSLSPDQLDRIFSLADELREEDGSYLESRDSIGAQRRSDNGCDLMPLVVDGAEWARIEGGLTQRV